MSTTKNEHLDFILGRRSIRVYSPGEVSEAAVDQTPGGGDGRAFGDDQGPLALCPRPGPADAGEAGNAPPGRGHAVLGRDGDCGRAATWTSAFERQISYLLQDCSAAIENLLLAAHAQGLGACWVGIHPGEPLIKRVRELLSLPASFVPVAVVSLGRPGEQPPPRTRFNADYVRREKW